MPVNSEDYNSDVISGEKLRALMQDEVYDRLKGDVPESIAVFLCSLKAQVDSIQKAISEKNLGECVADSIDAQNLSVKGEGVKIRQNPVNTYSIDSTKVSQFVDSVTQNENGEIVVHKRDVQQSSTSQSGIVQLYDGVDSSSSSLAASALAAKTANETTLNMSRSGAITGKLHIDQLAYPNNNRMVRVTDSSRTVDAGALVPDPGYNNAGRILSVGNYGDLVWDGIHAGVSLSANGTQVQLLDGNNQVISTANIESTGGLTYKGAITPTEWNPIDGEIGIGTPAAVLGDMYIASRAGYVNGRSLQGGSIIICKVASVPAAVPQDPPGAESWDDWNAQYPNTWDFIDINASASGNKIDGPATSSPNQMVLFDNNFGNVVKAGPTFNPSTGVLDVTATAAYGYVGGGAIAQALNSKAADSHVHGNITNDGKMNTAVAIGSGDCLLIRDASDNNIIKAATVGFDGSTDDSFLSKKGIWSNTVKYAKDYASGGTIDYALALLASGVNSKQNSFGLGEAFAWDSGNLSLTKMDCNHSSAKMFNDPTNPQVFDLSDSTVNGGIGQQYWKIVLNGGGSSVHEKTYTGINDVDISDSDMVEITYDVCGEYYDVIGGRNYMVTVEPVIDYATSGNIVNYYEGIPFLDSAAARFFIDYTYNSNDQLSESHQTYGYQGNRPFNLHASVTLPSKMVRRFMQSAAPDIPGYNTRRNIYLALKCASKPNDGQFIKVRLKTVWMAVRTFKFGY